MASRGVATLGALLGLALAGCQQTDETPAPASYTGPLLQTENVVTMISDSARPHIRLAGPLKQQYENGDIVYAKGALVTFYDKTGKQVVNTIQAKWAKYEGNKQLYVMRGNVQVANVPERQRLDTEELFYDRAKQRIYTDPRQYVRVETPLEVLTGYGLTASQDFSRYGITRPTGTFTLEEARTLGK